MLLRKGHEGLRCLRPRSRTLSLRRHFVPGSLDVDVSGILHPEVRLALEENRPVVALESTIISHGMPYPENLAMAR